MKTIIRFLSNVAFYGLILSLSFAAGYWFKEHRERIFPETKNTSSFTYESETRIIRGLMYGEVKSWSTDGRVIKANIKAKDREYCVIITPVAQFSVQGEGRHTFLSIQGWLKEHPDAGVTIGFCEGIAENLIFYVKD